MSLWFIESGLYERIAPGAVGFIIGRERYIDDYLKACLGDGFNQVVILGAGFARYTRAFRIPRIDHRGCSRLINPRLKRSSWND